MTARYVHGSNIAADDPLVDYVGSGLTTRRFLETDHQGSVILIGDSSGGTVATNRYDEYGVPQAGNVGRFQYTGQIWLSELGLYHYKARLYSPLPLGRLPGSPQAKRRRSARPSRLYQKPLRRGRHASKSRDVSPVRFAAGWPAFALSST